MESGKGIDIGRDLHAWERTLLTACDLYLVGGTVRDILMGAGSGRHDEDYLASGISLEDLVTRLRPFGEANLVGKVFGVVKFTPSGAPMVDISLPRREFSTGVGHCDFSVSFDPFLPIEEDLSRRDYTINSMALELRTGIVTDPLGGMRDLGARLLRVNREDSFREDPLRILRGVQFMARFGFTVEGDTRALMRRDGELLVSVPPERVRDELNKMLLHAAQPSRGFIFLHDEEMLNALLPELDSTYGEEQNEYHPDDIFMHCVKSCDFARPELPIRWSALLHDLGKKDMKRIVDGRVVFYRHEERSAAIAEAILERLRFSRDFTRRVVGLIEHHMFNITDDWSDSAVRRFMARAGRDNIEDLLALREADALSRGDETVISSNRMIKSRIDRIRESDAALTIADLAITGNDVMETLGIGEGREVGKVLDRLLEIVLENPQCNTRERLIAFMRDLGEQN